MQLARGRHHSQCSEGGLAFDERPSLFEAQKKIAEVRVQDQTIRASVSDLSGLEPMLHQSRDFGPLIPSLGPAELMFWQGNPPQTMCGRSIESLVQSCHSTR